MTKRSMTSFRKQLQGAYNRGWMDAYAKLWAELQLPEGVKLKDGRTARAVIEAAPEAPAPETTLGDELKTIGEAYPETPPVEDEARNEKHVRKLLQEARDLDLETVRGFSVRSIEPLTHETQGKEP